MMEEFIGNESTFIVGNTERVKMTYYDSHEKFTDNQIETSAKIFAKFVAQYFSSLFLLEFIKNVMKINSSIEKGIKGVVFAEEV